MSAWYESAYRRAVIDMHITDHDPRFLANLDPAAYVDALVTARAQSAVIYAHSHVGLCLYPTRVGEMHSGLRGRDTLREIIERCHAHDIAAVLYVSAIHDRWAYQHHPEWRMVRADGRQAAESSRHGFCCPNSPYRTYLSALATEICQNYALDGIRFDMTFWPVVCYCRHCQARFADEVGGDLPRTIDWSDPHWVAFQHKREDWLVEFATLQMTTVKKIKPQVSVEHQASTYTHTWLLGVDERLARQCDFLQGDFYGDALQGSFARKLFRNLGEHQPSGFETSIGVELTNYTTLKSEALLTCKASAALADGCAFIFIDSIEPDGSLNPEVYQRMGRVLARTQPYEPFLGGVPCQDVAIYLSTASKFDPADNGKPVDSRELSGRQPHVEAALNVARALCEHHLPFGVITRRNLGELARFPVLVLPNVLQLDDEEVAALRAYVRAGGALFASRTSSLIDEHGQRRADFALADVYGISVRGDTAEAFTYIAPAPGHEALFPGYTSRYPLGSPVGQLLLQPHAGVQVLGTLVLPYTNPADPEHYASVHNNPPGIWTEAPAIVHNLYGRGQAIYCAVDLDASEVHRAVLVELLRRLAPPFSFEADAPVPVEVTLWRQPDQRRFILTLVNFPKDLPSIAMEGIRVRVRLHGRVPTRVTLLPEQQAIAYTLSEDYLVLEAPRLETLAMFAIEYA
jgi:hypothetical protein